MKFISPSEQWVWERKPNWPYFYFYFKNCWSFVSPSCQKSWGLQSICFLFQTRFGALQKRTKRWKFWMPIQWRIWVHACADYLNVPNDRRILTFFFADITSVVFHLLLSYYLYSWILTNQLIHQSITMNRILNVIEYITLLSIRGCPISLLEFN